MHRPTKHLFLILILSIGFFPAICAAEQPVPAFVTLTQCYDWARTQSEALRIREETIKQSRARAQSAIGEAFPRIAWKLNETWNDPTGVEELESAGFSGFVEKRQTESKFTLEQPLFSGLREFSAYSGFKHESRRDTLRYERASFELYSLVSLAFYHVVNAETSLKNAQTARDLAEDRVKELQGFVKLGKSRVSEVYSAQAFAAGWKAKIDQYQAEIKSNRHELSFLTGRELTQTPLVDQLASTLTVGTLEEALAAGEERTDIRAQHEEVEALKLRIRYEKGFHWPTADVTGNYYTERATFLDKIDWDVLLSVDFPLFQGGTVSAGVKEARSAHRQSVLEMQRLKRYIDYTIRKTYVDLAGAIKEAESLNEAVRAAQKSYDSLGKEYRLGLVTNLDVLQALNFLQERKSEYDTAVIKSKILFIQLHMDMEKMI